MLTKNNHYTFLRRELAATVLKLVKEKRLVDEIDFIPIKNVPKDQAFYRCCIYKDRAMMRSRLLSIMGFDIDTEEDEISLLSTYAKQALEKEDEKPASVLTTLTTACSSCARGQYRVTDLCRGCLARPCVMNCPRQAITIIDNKAVINTDLCVNCGKCNQVCPFHAILYVPVPCEDACPVKAIIRDDAGHVRIDEGKCIYCGKCSRTCPFGAIVERSQVLPVAKKLASPHTQVTAIIAPSIEGQFPGSLGQIKEGLKALGFARVKEVAEGAAITAREEAKELTDRLKEEPFMTTSCCSAFVASIQKHLPNIADRISHTRSPMSFTAKLVREKHPEDYIVFIGPCIAKKHEGAEDPNIDAVMTFEELAAFLVAWDVDIQKMPEEENLILEELPRTFAVSGGVSAAVVQYLPEGRKVEVMKIDGITKKTMRLMNTWAKRAPEADLIEGMCCEHGCIGGPGCISDVRLTQKLFHLENELQQV